LLTIIFWTPSINKKKNFSYGIGKIKLKLILGNKKALKVYTFKALGGLNNSIYLS